VSAAKARLRGLLLATRLACVLGIRTSRSWISVCALLAVLGPGVEATATAGAAGNPYSFYRSVAACAAAERNRCEACLADGSCEAITDLGDGDAECAQLAADDGRGYSLICVNLALAIDAVASCAASRAPACPRDTRASESLSSLDANAGFLDDPACAAPLDGCLARLYGSSRPDFPGGPSSGGSPPRDRSGSCDDSCSGDTNCDESAGCEVDASDDGCSDSSDSSGCEDSGAGEPGTSDGCSGDSEDSCGSEDNSSCDDSDCGGGGDSDCDSSGGGGDCEGGGGGDCDGGGGGGDCGGGGGGDCGGGGGGDCNVSAKHGRAGATLPIAVAWALLPLPFAIIVRRRAERRRARAAWDAERRAEREVAP